MSEVRALVERLDKMDTCTVSDALDALGLPGSVIGIRPLWDCPKIAGRVATVGLGPASAAKGMPARHLGSAAIAAAEPGDVIVVDNRAGKGESAGWGGLLSLAASIKEVAGVVVYGAARDVDDVAEVGLPYYAHSATPRTARGRTVEMSNAEPLEFAEVTVSHGDLVLADRSGVVFLKAAEAATVLDKADELYAKEAEMAAQLRAGVTVTDVLSGNYESMLKKG
ncbi:MAG: RraA family protein [Nitrososphaerales archaeon]